MLCYTIVFVGLVRFLNNYTSSGIWIIGRHYIFQYGDRQIHAGRQDSDS